jgi:hypothetical protein
MLIESMRKRLTADRASFIEPCLPSPTEKPPSSSDRIHEIKHNGYQLMARRDPVGFRLLTRNGYDWALRYPLIIEAVNHLKVRSCLIDGEVVCCDERGLDSFRLLRHEAERAERLSLRLSNCGSLAPPTSGREPIEVRKSTLPVCFPRVCDSTNTCPTPATSSSGMPQDGPGGIFPSVGIAITNRWAEVQRSGGPRLARG